MIVGKLKDVARYKGLSKNIDTAIDFILNNDLLSLPKGKTLIDGDDVYVNRDTYIARPLEECYFEGHTNYLDMQIVLKGKEGFGYTDITDPGLKVTTPYNDVKDVTKYANKAEKEIYITLEEGFALVFPEDIHLAKLDVDGKTIEKAVIKIRLDK